MEEIKIGERALVEMNVAGWDKIAGDYQMRPKEDTRTFWASKETVYPVPTKTYDEGLNEAWELAKKIIRNVEYGGLHESELEEIFGYSEFDDVLKNYTPQEAAAKIAEWEVKQKIHVGDVVELVETGTKGFITRSDDDGEDLYIVWEDGKHGRFYKSRESLKRTGRTIDIAGLLAQIGGAES